MNLVILGAGGHGKVVADAARLQAAWPGGVSATDRNPARCGGSLVDGVPVGDIGMLDAPGAAVHVAIGDAEARMREASQVAGRLATVVHPRASVAASATLAPGVFVAAGAIVGPAAAIGVCTILNHGSVVDHDCSVGEGSHIGPLASLGGGVHVGSRTLVGAGARVLPGLRVADGVVVGAGAVVTQSIDHPGVYAGVPARRVR